MPDIFGSSLPGHHVLRAEKTILSDVALQGQLKFLRAGEDAQFRARGRARLLRHSDLCEQVIHTTAVSRQISQVKGLMLRAEG